MTIRYLQSSFTASKVMKFTTALLVGLWATCAGATPIVMNPGETHGQIIILSPDDVRGQSAKYLSLNALSIPVFAEMPMELTVVAGVITLQKQNLLSHVQIKSKARRTPNLDISNVENGLSNPILALVQDGDWVHMILGRDGSVEFRKSSEDLAKNFLTSRNVEAVRLTSNTTDSRIRSTSELSWRDSDIVGSKAANYAELAIALNTPEREVVRPGYAVPFYYFEQFLSENPGLERDLARLYRNPLLNRDELAAPRESALRSLRERIMSDETVINEHLIDELLRLFQNEKNDKGQLRSMKLRSSTNSEDLPNFNGAGLYQSASYKPMKKKVERSETEKRAELKKALKTVWSSVWTQRAYEERMYFRIPHADVKMGIQVNPSFSDEIADGVVVTRNMSGHPELTAPGVFIEAQRGDNHSVANPQEGVRAQQILVLYDPAHPLDQERYQVHVLQNSNIDDDTKTILPIDNPKPVMFEAEARDLAFQCLKAEAHFKPRLGPNTPNFALDLEFKVDRGPNGQRQVYLKQARPLVD